MKTKVNTSQGRIEAPEFIADHIYIQNRYCVLSSFLNKQMIIILNFLESLVCKFREYQIQYIMEFIVVRSRSGYFQGKSLKQRRRAPRRPAPSIQETFNFQIVPPVYQFPAQSARTIFTCSAQKKRRSLSKRRLLPPSHIRSPVKAVTTRRIPAVPQDSGDERLGGCLSVRRAGFGSYKHRRHASQPIFKTKLPHPQQLRDQDSDLTEVCDTPPLFTARYN